MYFQILIWNISSDFENTKGSLYTWYFQFFDFLWYIKQVICPSNKYFQEKILSILFAYATTAKANFWLNSICHKNYALTREKLAHKKTFWKIVFYIFSGLKKEFMVKIKIILKGYVRFYVQSIFLNKFKI